MLCERCNNNPASVHLKTVNGNQLHKLDLCVECAEQIKLAAEEKIEQEIDQALDVPVCECGMTIHKVIKEHRMGCQHCYATFGSMLSDSFLLIHGATQHVGRLPRQPEKSRLNEMIKSLQAALNAAIAEENYEKAAAIRDQLKNIQGVVAERQTH